MRRHWSSWWIAFGVPVLVAAGAMILLASWADELPDPVATHWDGSGEADGFQSLDSLVWSFGAVVVGITLFSAVIMAAVKVPSRALTSFHTGLAVFIAVLLAGSVHVQRGIENASGQELPGAWFAIALFAGLAVAGLAALITRPDRHDDERSPPPRMAPSPVGAPVPAALTGTATSRSLLVLSLVLLAGALALAFVSWPVGLLSGALMAPLVLINSWRVTADSSGFTVRTHVPLVRLRADLDSITGVDVLDVKPMADFGGWGIRMGSLASPAVVMRAGPAVRVHRRDKRPLLVTIDDAESFARVIDSHVATR